MATSALVAATTRFEVDAVLFDVMVSVVVVLIVEVMLSVVPAVVPLLTCTTGRKVAPAPARSDAMLQVIVPPEEPTAGSGEQFHPAGTGMDWKFTVAGNGMETTIVDAVGGPLLMALTVYV